MVEWNGKTVRVLETDELIISRGFQKELLKDIGELRRIFQESKSKRKEGQNR